MEKEEKALKAIWQRGFNEAIRLVKERGKVKKLFLCDRSEPVKIYVLSEDDFFNPEDLPKSKKELEDITQTIAGEAK